MNPGRAVACVVLIAVGLAGCGGGDSEPAPKHPAQAGSTLAQVAPGQTTPATSRSSSAKHSAHKPKTHRRTSSAAAPRSVVSRPSTKPKAKRKPEPALRCLARARLQRPHLQRPGLWAGEASGFPVLVDGPYRKTKDARESAASLAGGSAAESGGLYVVSAAITAHLDAKIHQVALCLGNGLVGASVPSDPNGQS